MTQLGLERIVAALGAPTDRPTAPEAGAGTNEMQGLEATLRTDLLMALYPAERRPHPR